jgi:hypothetical protein
LFLLRIDLWSLGMSKKMSSSSRSLGWWLVPLVLVIGIIGISSWFGRMLGQLQQETAPPPARIAKLPEPRKESRDLSKLFPQPPPPRGSSRQKSLAWEAKMRQHEEDTLRRMQEQKVAKTPPPTIREAFRVGTLQRSALKEWAERPLEESGARYAPNLRFGRPLGMQVTNLENGSFLHNIGLREGDVLLEVSGKPVYSPGSAREQYLQAAKRYRNLNLRYTRNGHTYMMDISLRESP